MLGKLKNFINNYIKKVVAEQQTADEAAAKEKATKVRQRDFGANISSMDLKPKDVGELIKLSFQKGIKDFVAQKTTAEGVAMDSSASIKDLAVPAVDIAGTTKDIVYTFFTKFGFIGWQNCAILAQHWLISNACSLPAKDAIRNGWINTFADADKQEATGEEKEKEQKFLNELNEITNTKYALTAKAIEWITKYNIYGIGIALPKIDGIDYEKPYNPDGIKKGSFKGISIIDPYWLTPQFDEEFMTDPTHPNFYKPTHYLTASGQKIHASHFIIIRRKEVPDILKPSYYFGGIPLTQEIFERVYAAEKSANEQPLLLLTKRLNGWKIDLNEFFLDPEKYRERIKNFTETRDNQGVLLVDHEDDMFQIDTALSDLDEVVMSQYKLVAAVARIPVDKLFELNPSGTLSNSGDFNIKNYTQDLNTIQNDLCKPFIDRINEIVMRSHYDKKDKIAIIFNPTDNPTAQEQATNVKTEVDTLQALIGNNVITTEEARQKLIADKRNGFSFLDEEAPEQEQDNAEIAEMMKQAGKQPQQQQKAEDTDWITVHPHGNKETKGQPVPIEEGQGKGEAIKQHFARAAAGETHMYNDNDDDDDFDFSFNPEVIEEQEELAQRNKEQQKAAKKEARQAKREQTKWENMSEEERDKERNEQYEAEQKREKQAKKETVQKTLPEAKKELEDMGIMGIRKPTKEGYGKERWSEYESLSPRIKRYFFDKSDSDYSLKWDEAEAILQQHKGDTADIFEYLREIDIKTPHSRTNERTRKYLEGSAEDNDFDESKVNRDEKGRFASKGTAKITQPETEISSKEFNEKLTKAETTKITKIYKDYRDVEKKLKEIGHKDITNKDTGSVAQVNNAQRDKLVSKKAIDKSKENGFSREEHLSAAAEIKQLYEKAIFKGKRKDEENNDMFIKRFVAPVAFDNKKAYAKITAKETIVDGERIYSVELHSLEQIGKKEAFDNWE